MGYLLYDHDDYRFVVIEVVTLISGMFLATNELRPGYGLAYSKFTTEFKGAIKKVPSRVGMLIIYTPAALAGFWFFAESVLLRRGEPVDSGSTIGSLKVRVLSTAIFVHFFKRDLESLLLHRYSGETGLASAIVISSFYAILAALLDIDQQRSEQLTPPVLDLTWVGVVVFLTGILGNFYHHFLLRGLRKGGEKKYVIPEGGLFGVFVAAHYIFEIVGFLGFAMIAQTYLSVAVLLLVCLYLTCRTYSTKQWYLKKVDGFPRSRCVLIPHVF